MYRYWTAREAPPVSVIRGRREDLLEHGPHIHDFPVLWYAHTEGVVYVVAAGAVIDPNALVTGADGVGVFFDPAALGHDAGSPWPAWQAHPLLFPFLHGRPGGLLRLAIPADRQAMWDSMIRSIEDELTGRVEAAEQRGDAATAARLTGLREHILQFSQRLDEAQRAAVQEYTTVLGEILAANDIQQAMAERAAYIDQNFLSVLSANLQEAEKRGAGAAMQRLQEVWDVAVDMINQGAPPEARLINELLLAEYPGETRKLLAENRALVTAEFIEALSELAERLEAEDEAEMATRLRQIRSQAQLMR